MPFVTVNGIEMYYEEHGSRDGEPVLLIAGLSLNTTTWFRQMPALADAAWLVRGPGRSLIARLDDHVLDAEWRIVPGANEPERQSSYSRRKRA